MEELEKMKESLSLDNWDMHHKIKTDAYREADRIVFIVGAGSFGASLTFLGFSKTSPQWWPILLLSWVCILMSLYFLMDSHEKIAKGSLRNQALISLWRIAKGDPDATLALSIDRYMNTNHDPKIQELDREARNLRENAKYFLKAGIFFLLLFALVTFAQSS